MSETAAGPASRPWKTSRARVNRMLGRTFIVTAVLFFILWWSGRGTDRHGAVLVFIGALTIGPAGVLFALAGVAMQRRWRLRWLLQLLPLAYPFLFFKALAAGLV